MPKNLIEEDRGNIKAAIREVQQNANYPLWVKIRVLRNQQKYVQFAKKSGWKASEVRKAASCNEEGIQSLKANLEQRIQKKQEKLLAE